MAFTFTNATLLGYQLNKNYLGEGLFSTNTTKDISIEGIFLNLTGVEGVSNSLNKISEYLTGIENVYDSIIINNYNLGSGKILNISFPDQNPVRLGHYVYNIEVLENSDFSNVQTGDIYGTFLSGVKNNINSFDETLNFENADNGDYSYNHDINIEFNDDKSDLFTKSKNFAESIYNDNLNIGLIGSFSGFYNILKTKKNYFSETYDLINKRCSFSKRILINKNYNSDYTISIDHNLTFDGNGKITVTENGKIKALNNTLAYTAENYFNTELSNSYTRCQDIFNTYTEKYGLGQKDSLYNQPFNLGKTANEFENSLEYNVSYVNDPSFEGNIINNYNITINQDAEGIINYSEQGDLIQIGQIGSIINLNLIKAKYLDAKTRVAASYPNLKLKSSSLSAGILGVDYIYMIIISNQTFPNKVNGIYLRSSGGTTKFIGPARNDGDGPPAYSLYPEIWWDNVNGWWGLSLLGEIDGEQAFKSYDLINWISVNDVWDGIATTYKTTYNNNFSYSLEKTSDSSILDDNPYYKNLSMSIEDREPFDFYKEYIIANRNPKNIFFVSGNQIEMGNKTITINGSLVKPTTNFWETPINFPLDDLKKKSVSGAFDLISSEAYIDSINYDYDSENNFSFNLNVKYLKKAPGT